ncbi:MAG: cytidylate kinase-like family protein [bacterium]|nr:cytidylate kinase-like family protein [bacterium]
MKHFVVTIGREFGSKGCAIGTELAKQLGVNLYDKDLVEEAAKKLQMDEETVRSADEVSAKDMEDIATTYGVQNFYISTQVLAAQAEFIEEVADKESCVIMGRCADYILKDRPDCLKIYIYAPFTSRVKHIMEEYKLSEFAAKRMVKQTDAKRDEYYQYVTGISRGEHTGKDLMIDSSLMGVEETVNMIKQMVEKKFA